MSSGDLLSYLFAVVAAGGNALANVMQRKASLRQQDAALPGSGFNLSFVRGLVRDPTWTLGLLGMVGSFGFQAVALGVGQLSAVETIITLEVPLTLILANRILQTRLERSQWTSIAVLTVGMVALVAALDPSPGRESTVRQETYLIAGGATLAAIAGLVLVSRGLTVFWRTAALGAAVGSTFGLTASLMKAVIDRLTSHGVVAILTGWQTYAGIGTGIAGVLLMQVALHAGPLVAAQPGFTLMDPVVSVLWGVLVYQETTRIGGWLVLAGLGAAAVVTGVIWLARTPLAAEQPG